MAEIRLPIFWKQTSSEEFEKAFGDVGNSAFINCQECGRTHFNSSDTGCFEEGELDELLAKEEANPDAYVGVDYTIGWAFDPINGKQFVFGCPCHYDGQLEAMLWSSRHPIAKYLTLRAAKEKKEADETAKQMVSMNQALSEDKT